MVINYMKSIRLLFSIICLILISACAKDQNKQDFTVKGNLSNINSPYFFIAIENSDSIKVDTIFVDAKGSFNYEGSIDKLSMASLFFNEKSWSTAIFVDKGLNIEIKGNANRPDLIMVNGGEVNNDLTTFKKNNSKLLERKADLLHQINSANNGEMVNGYDTELKNINFELTDKAKEYIRNNPDKIASVVLIQDFYKNNTSIESLDKELSSLTGEAADFSLTKELLRYSENAKRSLVGSVAPKLEINQNGKDFKLESLKGKFVFLTFGTYDTELYQPQLSSMINVYKSLKNKNIEFVSVIIDAPEKKITVPDSIKWKVFYEHSGWASKLVKDYNISLVPYGILISPEGIILDRGISSISLGDKIDHYQKAENQ